MYGAFRERNSMLTNRYLVAITTMFLIVPLMGSGRSEENAPELNFEIKTDKYEYLQAEPIRITVFLKNISETDFSIEYKASKQRAAEVTFFEVGDDGTLCNFGRAIYPRVILSCGNTVNHIEYKRTWSIDKDSSHIDSHWLSDRSYSNTSLGPGEHTIRAIFRPLPSEYKDLECQSKDIKIKIVRPVGHDLEAYKLITGREMITFGNNRRFSSGFMASGLIFNSGSHLGRPLHEHFVKIHNASTYANYVRYTLARDSLSRYPWEDIREMLEFIKLAPRNFPLLADAYARLLEHYKRQGEADEMEILSRGIELDELTITNPTTAKRITDIMKHVQTLEKNAIKRSSTGKDRLYEAAKDGHYRTVRLFIAGGADVNAVDEGGRTPLYVAAEYGHKETVRILIAAGADVNVRCTSFGRTAIFWPCGNGHTDVAEILIANGADINVRGRFNETPLLCAVIQNKIDVVKLLITNGADVNAKCNRSYWRGGTPLHLAVSANNKEIVKLLLEGSADVDALDNNDNTPLDRAIELGNKELVRIISSYERK